MDLHDFRQQIVALKRLGPVHHLMAKMPGLDLEVADQRVIDLDRESRRILGMIDSMMVLERSYPFLIAVPGRCARIAEGAGVLPSDVVNFFVQYKAFSDLVMRIERVGWCKV